MPKEILDKHLVNEKEPFKGATTAKNVLIKRYFLLAILISFLLNALLLYLGIIIFQQPNHAWIWTTGLFGIAALILLSFLTSMFVFHGVLYTLYFRFCRSVELKPNPFYLYESNRGGYIIYRTINALYKMLRAGLLPLLILYFAILYVDGQMRYPIIDFMKEYKIIFLGGVCWIVFLMTLKYELPTLYKRLKETVNRKEQQDIFLS